MKSRILPLMLAAAVVSLSTGCSGMRDFLFGRGAQCGLCNRLSGAVRPLAPLAPPPGPCATAPAPAYPPAFAAPGSCNCGPQAGISGVPFVGSGYADDCGCGISGYRGVDPYLNGVYSESTLDDGTWMRRDENGDPIIGVGPTTVTPLP